MKKKLLVGLLSAAMLSTMLTACGSDKKNAGTDESGKKELNVAALEGGYGKDMYNGHQSFRGRES